MKYIIGRNMNKKILINISLIGSFLITSLLPMSAGAESKLYKWVDSEGRISYQGKPPPQNSKILSEETLKIQKKESEKKVIAFKNSSPIDVYINKNCPGCDQVLGLLETWEVPHNIKMINDHRDIQKILIQETSTIGVPALFYDGKLFSNIDTVDGLKDNLIKTEHVIPAPEPEPQSPLNVESKTETEIDAESEYAE